MNIGAANVVALVLFISLAIERIATALIFVLSLMTFWQNYFHNPLLKKDIEKRAYTEKIHRIIYFAIISLLVTIAIIAIKINGEYINIFSSLGFDATDGSPGRIITGLVLVAGSDFLGRLIEKSGAYDKSELEGQTIKVQGELNLKRGTNSDTPSDKGSV